MPGKNLKISILCYFFIAVVLDGLQRLSGLFVFELLQTTNVNRQTATVPFIFSWIVSNIIASFSDTLVDNKKSEHLILSGVLLSAAGAAFCMLATNTVTLTVFWGLLFGSGHGLTSPHLSKRLQNADCTKLSFILQVTSSLGVVIMPFALNVLNSYYGLQGSCLMFSGLILNYLPLALAATYNIEISIPNIKWRVRKKSKQYSVSKQDEAKTISNESFTNSLEPDLILKICQNDDFPNGPIRSNSELFTSVEIVRTGRKRSETRSNDLQGLENRIFPKNRTNSPMLAEIQNYEKGRKGFELSFNNKHIVNDATERTKSKTDSDINCDIINSIKLLKKDILNKDKESELNFKNTILRKISECETNQNSENNELTKFFENHTGNSTALTNTANMTLHNLDLNNDGIAFQTDERHQKEIKITSKTEQVEQLYCNSPKKFQTTKPLEKENQQLPSHLENKFSSNLPLDIKVHVEECIFQTVEDDWEDYFNSKYLTARKNSSRNHSKSLMFSAHKNIHCQNFSKSFSKCSEAHKSKLSSIYSISENPELDDNSNISEGEKYIQKSAEAKRILNTLRNITSLVCLCILIIKIIFTVNLVTLLIMFADFGNDVDKGTTDLKWILVAFGAGGLIGKFCCCKISRTIPEKSHAIGVVLFLLNGLSTAGVLYSSNLNWLASFYCILGALEGGITYIMPKFVLEYVDKSTHSTLSFVQRFLSGAAIICIPFAIGLFRDEMGEYEFLLQTLSCSSVLCAILAYFLPYFRTASNKIINPAFKHKMETA